MRIRDSQIIEITYAEVRKLVVEYLQKYKITLPDDQLIFLHTCYESERTAISTYAKNEETNYYGAK